MGCFLVTLAIIAVGCSSPNPSTSGLVQSNGVAYEESTTGTRAESVLTFRVVSVEVTSKPQNFATCAFSGDSDETRKIAPPKGKVFVIVSFSVDVPTENLSYDRKKDFILSDSVTSAMYWGKESWMEGNSFVYERGTSVRKMLYVLSSDRVRGATMHFFGMDYPIEPFLKE